MAKIENIKKKFKSGYTNVFGNNLLGELITKVHSVKITNGTELEKLIENEINPIYIIDDVDEFLDNISEKDNGIYIINKKNLKKSKKFTGKVWVDFLIIEINNKNKHCFILELKSGSALDTKKSKAEKTNLETFQNMFSKKILLTSSIHICSFFENDKKNIIKGLKGEFTEEEIFTGNELCEKLNINMQNINKKIELDQSSNLNFFIKEFINIIGLKKIVELYNDELIKILNKD